MKLKIRAWLKRYLIAEIFALIGSLIGGIGTNFIFHNPIITAFGGTWGDNIGYYGTIIVCDIKKNKKKQGKVTCKSLLKIVRNLFLEFGPGEYIDGFIGRPFAMYFFPKILNNLSLGLIVGKIAADVIFYLPTIILYELRNKFLPD